MGFEFIHNFEHGLRSVLEGAGSDKFQPWLVEIDHFLAAGFAHEAVGLEVSGWCWLAIRMAWLTQGWPPQYLQCATAMAVIRPAMSGSAEVIFESNGLRPGAVLPVGSAVWA